MKETKITFNNLCFLFIWNKFRKNIKINSSLKYLLPYYLNGKDKISSFLN